MTDQPTAPSATRPRPPWRRERWDEPGTIYFWSGRRGQFEAFSNFAPTPFAMPAWHDRSLIVQFATGEHAFQAAKARTAADHERIRLAGSPARGQARRPPSRAARRLGPPPRTRDARRRPSEVRRPRAPRPPALHLAIATSPRTPPTTRFGDAATAPAATPARTCSAARSCASAPTSATRGPAAEASAMSQLYIVEVDDQCNPTADRAHRLLLHLAPAARSPGPRARPRAAELHTGPARARRRPLVGADRRRPARRPPARRPGRRPAHHLTGVPQVRSRSRPRSSWRCTVRRLSPVSAEISS